MDNHNNYLNGLTSFIESAFPKTCAVCGKKYLTAEQFLTETDNMPSGRSSLKEALEDDGTSIVEVFRNCGCGSTLMDEFNCRRDDSERGQKKRDEFNKLLQFLESQNVPTAEARTEILKLYKGEKSEQLNKLLSK